jgi:hypothetical protein
MRCASSVAESCQISLIIYSHMCSEAAPPARWSE